MSVSNDAWFVHARAAELLEQHGGWAGLSGQVLVQLLLDVQTDSREQRALLWLIQRAQIEGQSELVAAACRHALSAGHRDLAALIHHQAITVPELFEPFIEIMLQVTPYRAADLAPDGQPLEAVCATLEASQLPPARWTPPVPELVAACLCAALDRFCRRDWPAMAQCLDHAERHAQESGSQLGLAVVRLGRAEVDQGFSRRELALEHLVAVADWSRTADESLLLAYSQCRRADLLRPAAVADAAVYEAALAALREAAEALTQEGCCATRLDVLVPLLLASLLMTRPAEAGDEADRWLDHTVDLCAQREQRDQVPVRAAEDLLDALLARTVRSLIAARWEAAGRDLARFSERLETAGDAVRGSVGKRLRQQMSNVLKRLEPAQVSEVLAATGAQRDRAEELAGRQGLRDVP